MTGLAEYSVQPDYLEKGRLAMNQSSCNLQPTICCCAAGALFTSAAAAMKKN